MTNLQILGAPQSPLVWATRMAAVEKGIDADNVPLFPHTPEILAVQPFGKIPAMRHGKVELGESRAIALYIDGLSDSNPLMPRDLAARARVEQWIMHYHTEVMPQLLGRYIVQYFFPSTPDGKPDLVAIGAAVPGCEKVVAVLERQLAGHEWMAGLFSLADIYYGPLLHYFGELPEGKRIVAASPNVASYRGRTAARPSFRATFPPPLPSGTGAA
jgi:glutathione S-transferase